MKFYEAGSNYRILKKEQYRSSTGMQSVAPLCQKLIDRN